MNKVVCYTLNLRHSTLNSIMYACGENSA